MFRIGVGLIVLTSAFGGSFPRLQQKPPAVTRPNFAGSWEPADQSRSSTLFSVGIGRVPANGRVVIEQRANRLTVTKSVPDDVLDRLLQVQGQFYPTVMYPIIESRGDVGVGALGDLRASWQGERLVLNRSQAGIRLITVSLSMDGDRLKKDAHTAIASEQKESTVSEWFVRAK